MAADASSTKTTSASWRSEATNELRDRTRKTRRATRNHRGSRRLCGRWFTGFLCGKSDTLKNVVSRSETRRKSAKKILLTPDHRKTELFAELSRQKKTGQPEFFAVRRFGSIVAHLPAGQIEKAFRGVSGWGLKMRKSGSGPFCILTCLSLQDSYQPLSALVSKSSMEERLPALKNPDRPPPYPPGDKRARCGAFRRRSSSR